jgi:hypothetical protein
MNRSHLNVQLFVGHFTSPVPLVLCTTVFWCIKGTQGKEAFLNTRKIGAQIAEQEVWSNSR